MGQVIGRAGGAGEVKDVVHRPVDLDRLRDIVLQEPEVAVAGQVTDIPSASRQQIVNTDDLMPLGEKALAEMRADKPGPSSDDGSQAGPPDMNLGRQRTTAETLPIATSYRVQGRS